MSHPVSMTRVHLRAEPTGTVTLCGLPVGYGWRPVAVLRMPTCQDCRRIDRADAERRRRDT